MIGERVPEKKFMKGCKKNVLIGAVLISLVFLVVVFVVRDSHILNAYLSYNYLENASSKNVIREYNVYISPLPAGVDGRYKNVTRESMAYWNAKNISFFREVFLEKEANVIVNWTKEFEGERLGRTLETGIVQIGLGDSRCIGKWKPYSYDSVLLIAKHELGHILGLNHILNESEIMYNITITTYDLDILESGIILDGSALFYPFCTSKQKANYSISMASTELIDFYVVLSKEEFIKVVNKKDFVYYPNCFSRKIKNYQGNCTVNNLGGIILLNPPSFLNLGSPAQFILKMREV